MTRVADYIIRTLHCAGIKHIFMVTGRGILFLSDAVARETSIIAVPTYHEQGASFAAMAYARATGKLSACLVSTGCAATNAITAALCAYQDNLPVVFISGQHMQEETTEYTKLPIRTYGSQEANIVAMVRSVTKYAKMLTDACDLPNELNHALNLAVENRTGPVWIDVPLDVQNLRKKLPTPIDFIKRSKSLECSSSGVDEIAAALAESERPLLLVGGGAINATTELKKFIERINIPVVFTPSACDIYGAGNNLSIGAIGSIGGSRTGNFALQNADFILAVGTRLCSQTTGKDFSLFAREAKIYVVDIDPIEHTKNEVQHEKYIIADAKNFFEPLLERSIPSIDENWVNKCTHWKNEFAIEKEAFICELEDRNEIDLYNFANELSHVLPDNATVITDAGFEELIIPAVVKFHGKQRCLFPAAQGAMGYAVPAIIGAHFAKCEKIFAVIGDGSIMMNVQEMQIIAERKIPCIIFVISNNMYAVIRKRQSDLFRKRIIGTDKTNGVPQPNFEKIALAFDFDYSSISNLSELRSELPHIISVIRNKPLLCEVKSSPEQKYLHQSYGRNSQGHLKLRPLEDLSPFLDREKLKKEMLIDILD